MLCSFRELTRHFDSVGGAWEGEVLNSVVQISGELKNRAQCALMSQWKFKTRVVLYDTYIPPSDRVQGSYCKLCMVNFRVWFMALVQGAWAINQREKIRIHKLQYRPEKIRFGRYFLLWWFNLALQELIYFNLVSQGRALFKTGHLFRMECLFLCWETTECSK